MNTKSNLYFQFQSDLGVTKHMGGMGATNELLTLCKIGKASKVLEIGCGVGKTATFIAKDYNCQVYGIDISQEMVEQSKKRTKSQGLENKIKFLKADACSLPFKDNSFDIVFGESVLAFIKDKNKALKEFLRVVKKDGFVGLNEAFWKKPATEKFKFYALKVMGARFETNSSLKSRLKKVGFKNIKIKKYKVSMINQAIEQAKWFSLKDYVSSWKRFLSQIFVNPDYRDFIKTALKYPVGLFKNMGYGIYVAGK